MEFIQILEFRTSKIDRIRAMDDEWRQATDGKRTLRRSLLCQDRNDKNRHLRDRILRLARVGTGQFGPAGDGRLREPGQCGRRRSPRVPGPRCDRGPHLACTLEAVAHRDEG